MDTERVHLGWMRWCGLAVVAVAAAALSFDTLRHLAIVCGTPVVLAWLLPIAVDAGAVVALSLWMSRTVPTRARRFARTVALSAIALSVAGNAIQHALVAYEVAPPWWAVVTIGAAPAAMLGAVAHLVALANPRQAAAPASPAEPAPTVTVAPVEPVDVEPVEVEPAEDRRAVASDRQAGGDERQAPADPPGDLVSRARPLVNAAEAEGRKLGRATLATELGVSEYQARQALRQIASERRPALHAVGGGGR